MKAPEVIFQPLSFNMQLKKVESEFLDDLRTFTHPTRFKIVVLLAEKPMHINAISQAIGIERRLVSFHLATLEEYGFLTSKYEISDQPRSKGRSLRIYQVTDKVAKMHSEMKKL